jgi:hypothetical protein
MPKIIEPDSAVDWYTTAQLCNAAVVDLYEANPNDPKAGRIDLYREVKLPDGRRGCMRIKLTVVHVDPG